MALVFYTQRDIANMDINNIPEEFINYYEGLSLEGKKRIIDARPDFAEILGVVTSADIDTDVEQVSIPEDMDEISAEIDGDETLNIKENNEDESHDVNTEIINNIYAEREMKELDGTALMPVHAFIIPDEQLKCFIHRKPLKKIQLKYQVKGTYRSTTYGFQPYCCEECHRLYLEESKALYYAEKFDEYDIEHRLFDLETTQKYLRSQMSEIEMSGADTLYVPDVWVEDNPVCPIHNSKLSKYPHVIIGADRVSFDGYICDECNKVLVRRTLALDIEEQCQDKGVNCPHIKPIRLEVKKKSVIKRKIKPRYMIENGKRTEFPYGEANENTYQLAEVDTVVVSDSSYCNLEGHETEQVEAVYTVSEKRAGKQLYISLIGYCSQCQKFYMDEVDYKVIYSYGRPEFVVIRDIEEDDYLVTSGEVYNLEKQHLQRVEGDISQRVHEIKSYSDYVNQSETASDYDEIAALQYKKSISREKYEPLLDDLYEMGDVPYRYRVDIVFANKTETYYIGAKDIVLQGEKKVISMASDMGRALVNTRTVHYIKDGMQYDVKLSREFDIKEAYLYGYKNIKTDEDAVFRAGITDPFLIRVLNQRKRQHGLVDIFVTIQENQNAIVDEKLGRNIIVQGCAGSGKTMVMLHRLYTLKYNHPDFDFAKSVILTPNEQFNLHIKGLADSLQIGSIDRMSIEQYYLAQAIKYSKDFAPSSKIASEVAVKKIFVDYIYTDEFLEKFAESYDSAIAERKNIVQIVENLYKGLDEPYSAIQINNESEFVPELRKRYLRLATMVQRNERTVSDAKAKLDAFLKKKDETERLLPDAESKANNIFETVLPRVYVKVEAYISEIEKKISEYNSEIDELAKQENNVQAQFLPFGKKAKLEEIKKQRESILRKLKLENKKLEEANLYKKFDQTDKTEDEIMLWLGQVMLIDKTIKNEVDYCNRTKRDYQKLQNEILEIEPQIEKAEEDLHKAESEKYSEDVYKAVKYLSGVLDGFSDYGLYREIFSNAIKEFVEKNKVKVPNGLHRYDLYISLWFCMKYYGKAVGDSKYICFDEGQDLAFNEYKLIDALNDKDAIFNIFGDTNQLLKLERGISSWDCLEKTFSMKMFYLNENYRNTNQITRFCNQSFGMDVKQTGVDGAKVREISRKELELELANLNITTERIAILIPRKVMKKNYLEMEVLPDKIKSVIGDKVDNGYISFMYVDEVKGIEFDKVFVVPNRMTTNEKYIAFTRALSELIIVVDENIPDVDDTESEKTEIGELVDYLRKNNITDAQNLYKQISDDWDDNQQIGFFVHLFTRVNQQERVLQLMAYNLNSASIKKVFNGLSIDQKDSIKKKVYGKKLQELLQTVYDSGNIEGFASLVGCMNAWDKIEFVPEDKRHEIYILSNSHEAGRLWVDSMSDSEITDFENVLWKYLDSMQPKIAFDICIYAYRNTDVEKEKIIRTIVQISKKNAKGNQEYSCPVDVLISLAVEAGNEWDLVRELVEKCSAKAFSDAKMRRYPQERLEDKVINLMDKLVNSSLSLDQKIFMFMNTSLREEAQIDKFYILLKEKMGISSEEFLKEMRKYWLVGKIKYVTEDGFVRIVPHNIAVTRLVCFLSTQIHISDEEGIWVEPKVGDTVYFILKHYDEERNFFKVHYPCLQPMEIKD